MRKAAAAAAAERKRVEAERIARENEVLRQRLARVKAVTDDDVNDDVMEGGAIGDARKRMAEKSRADRRARAAQLAKSNATARARLQNVKAVVDDDISDDVAGMARAGYDLHHHSGDGEYSS